MLVTGALLLGERDVLRRDLVVHSEGVARVLAKTLAEPLVHDNAWRAFEIINAPFNSLPGAAPAQGAELVMVLDAEQRVYVSSLPATYPMLANPGHIDSEFLSVQQTVASVGGAEPTAVVAPETGKLYIVQPIVTDGVMLGTLVMAYAGDFFRPRFVALAERAAWVTGGVLALLLPAGWFWGRLAAQPLVDLAGAMAKVGPGLPADDSYVHRYRGHDEIGRLGLAFKTMLGELRGKEALERQVIAADRLAAIGRLAAGIAHEINNPLGGMLNAINTYRRHGAPDPLAQRTLSLIERGLLQIKETVAALLVEAKVASHPLTRQDVDDTRTLVLADTQARPVELVWHNGVVGTLALPSTLTRQVLINLLLNAIHAAPAHGRVTCSVQPQPGALRIEVGNDGAHIPEDKLRYLFEPFSVLSRDGNGLGLWVIYQIVQQLRGTIDVRSQPGATTFHVTLPLGSKDEALANTDAVSG